MRVSVLVSVSAVRPPPEAQPLIDAALKLESKSDRFGEINLVNDIEEEERKDDVRNLQKCQLWFVVFLIKIPRVTKERKEN